MLCAGIKWSAIDFQDNQPVLEVIEGFGGVLALLQEECRLTVRSDPPSLVSRSRLISGTEAFLGTDLHRLGLYAKRTTRG